MKFVGRAVVHRWVAVGLITGCASTSGTLDELRSLQAIERTRLNQLVADTGRAEQKARAAEREARYAECRAASMKLAAEVASVATGCSLKHAATLKCTADVAKSQADSTLLGCLAGIGISLLSGGAAAPAALIGCGVGRLAGGDDSVCEQPACDPSETAAWRDVLARRAPTGMPMCGGQVGAELQYGAAYGLEVKQTIDGSDAQRMGIRAGDVLLRVGDQRVHSVSTLRTALAELALGDPLHVVVRRHDLTVALESVHTDALLGVQPGAAQLVSNAEVAIRTVTPNRAADLAGFREGDVLLAIAGERITDVDHARRLVAHKLPGERIELAVERRGRPMRGEIQLALREDPSAF